MPEHETLPPFPGSAIPHLGTYRRVLPVSLERLYENALDWEHLPHLHHSSFSDLSLVDAGAWGWRARVVLASGAESTIELRLDRACRRWITRTLEGAGRGAEIWTHAFPLAPDRVDIVVDFFAPDVPAEARARAGSGYARLYERLYDEDVAMMVERQRQLDRRIDRARDAERSLLLGPRAALALPVTVTLGGREVVVAEDGGELVAFPAQCPHQLGPLEGGALEAGVVRCPWHGDAFDVRSGENLSGRPCHLSHLPALTEDDQGRVWLTATH